MNIKPAYLYDEKTKAFIEESVAYLDIEESRIQKKDIFIFPPSSTDIKPPKQEKYRSAIFDGTKWAIVTDYSQSNVYHKETGEKIQLDFMEALPEFAIPLMPLEPKNGFVVSYDGKKQNWIYQEDHREKLYYSKKTGEPITITELGKIPDNLTDKQRLSIYTAWSDEEKNWIMTPEGQAQKNQDILLSKIAENENTCQELRAKAENKIAVLERKGKLDMLATGEAELLTALYRYTIALDALNLSQDNLSFPDFPE